MTSPAQPDRSSIRTSSPRVQITSMVVSGFRPRLQRQERAPAPLGKLDRRVPRARQIIGNESEHDPSS